MLVFGGEYSNSVEDRKETFFLRKKGTETYMIERGSDLPRGCTPANTSYTLNSKSSYYFISNEGYVFRLNKFDMAWSHWD
jgi:hypothetical protein